MSEQLIWSAPQLTLVFEWAEDAPVHLAHVGTGNGAADLYRVPAVEILTATDGHMPASDRLIHTSLGMRMRYIGHEQHEDESASVLVITQATGDIEARLVLRRPHGVAAIRSHVEVKNTSSIGDVVLRSVASWSAGFTTRADEGAPTADTLNGWDRVSGQSDWLGEGRWEREALRGIEFPQLAEHLTRQHPRSAFSRASHGTWSTGAALPSGALVHDSGISLAWQIEHNGAWKWEIGEDTFGGYLALSGPTDVDSAWTRVLAPGAEFHSVPVEIAYGESFEDAVAALTGYRRAARRPHVDNSAMPVIFNDYMNTLDGDPTTEKLLPLITAAAEVGAEVFCIDAGWYDDSGYWWDSVGEWLPSTTRFPGGLAEVIAAIRDAGMSPGLWLEPEVIGVRSPMAELLPADAFLQRHGQRVIEHSRYHLDLRHPAAVAHLDAVVDRLVVDFGVTFFKLDYNINPGAGTDLAADSPGDGLLEHNRAHLAWLDGVLDRHPDLVLENCGSGAMRMDFAMLSRLQMQSTSDQQDYTKYPPIAAVAPLSMLPEQAASWAYPQPGMSDEEASFCLVTGLLGRFYVSGYLNRMTASQRTRVATAIEVAKHLRGQIASATPYWPVGLPAWNDDMVVLGLRGTAADLISVWRRGKSDTAVLNLPHLRGGEVTVQTVFPLDLPEWHTEWDASTGELRVRASAAPFAARTLRIIHAPAGSADVRTPIIPITE
ncbi:glycoside hydrolase family 36 protein [Microbacterium sp. A204]|uniref:glycoside hydrolase family 36 protein n=1 Tax=Microbacterium sp. A204 TaxID=3457321 RepID=UPI003FD0DF4B